MLLSSHILAEVEALCDRVSIIRKGRTVETGTLADLRHLTRTVDHRRAGRPARTGWPGCPASTTSTSQGNRVRFEVDTDKLDAVLRHADRRGRAAA